MPDTSDSDAAVLARYSSTSVDPTIQKSIDSSFNPVSLLARRFNVGQDQVRNSRHNADLMSRNDLDEDTELQQIRAGAQQISGDVSQSAYEAQPWYLRTVDDAAQTLPMIGDTLFQGGVGGLAGATVGAGAGAATGGLAGAATFGGIGWEWGFNLGSVKSVWEQSTGELYGELRLAGVNRETAKGLSYTFGALNTGLEFVGLHNLRGLAGAAMRTAAKTKLQRALAQGGVREVEKNIVSRLGLKYAENIFTETATEGAQQASTELSKALAGLIQKHDANAFTDTGTASTNIKDAMLQAIGVAALLGAGSEGIGIAAGKAGEQVSKLTDPHIQNAMKALDGQTPTEILQTINRGLENMPDHWEKQTPEGSVVFGPNNEVLIKTGTAEGQATAPSAATTKLPRTGGQLALSDIVNDPQKIIDEGLNALYPETVATVPSSEIDGQQLRLVFKQDQGPTPPEAPPRPLSPVETQARLNQIASDTKALKRESAAIESHIQLKEKTGGGYQRLIDRWQNIGYALDDLDSERANLEAGFGTTETEANKPGQIRIKNLTSLMGRVDQLVEKASEARKQAAQAKEKARVSGEEVGFKKGAFTERRAIRAIQNELLTRIRMDIPDKATRDRVTKFIAGVTTPEQAKVAVDKIRTELLRVEHAKAEAADKTERAKVFAEVQRLVNKAKVTTQSGHPVANFPQHIVTRLQTLGGFLKDKQNIEAFQNEVSEKYGDLPITELPEDVVDKLQIAQLADNLYNADAFTRNIMANRVAQWVQEGKDIMAAKKEKKLAERQQILEAAQTSLDVQPVNKNYAIDKDKHAVGVFMNSWRTWNGLLDAMTSKDQTHELTKMLDETASRSQYLQSVEVTTQNLMKFLQDRMPGVDLLRKLREDSGKTYTITYTDSVGGRRTETFEKRQILDLMMKFRNSRLHVALQDPTEGNGFTQPGQVQDGESTVEKFRKVMDESDHALVNGLLDFYRDYYEVNNSVYEDEHGASLPRQENYSPTTRRGYKVEAPLSAHGITVAALLPQSSITSTQSKLAIVPQDPVETALGYIKDWEHFKAYRGVLNRMNWVLGDPTIRNHIEANHGAGTLEIMRNFFERFIKNDPIPSDPADSIWSALRADISRTALGFRASTMLTQLSSGTLMWADYSPLDLSKGFLQTVLHPVETERELRKSAILIDRYKSGSTVDLQRALQNNGVFASTLAKLDPTGFISDFTTPSSESKPFYDALNRAMFGAISLGDSAVARIFGGPVYHAELAKGATPEQALLTVERLMEHTQQSSSISQTPVAMTNPTINTLLTMFTQQPVQAFGRALNYGEEFFAGSKTPKEWMKLGHRIAVTWAVPGALLGLVRTLPSWLLPQDDNDERERAQVWDILGSVILGPAAGLPLIGDVLQALWFQAAKMAVGVDESKRGDFYGKNPLIEILYRKPTDAFKLWSKLENASEDPFGTGDLTGEKAIETKEQAEAATASAASSVLGLPSELGANALSAADRLKEGDLAGAAQALGGWSPGAVRQREAADEQSLDQLFDSLNTEPTPYDSIKKYLETLITPTITDTKKKEATDQAMVDQLIKGLENDRNAGNESDANPPGEENR